MKNIREEELRLHLACNAGHLDIVELLIKYKANVNIQSASGNTALHYAAGGVSERDRSRGGRIFFSRDMWRLFDCY